MKKYNKNYRFLTKWDFCAPPWSLVQWLVLQRLRELDFSRGQNYFSYNRVHYNVWFSNLKHSFCSLESSSLRTNFDVFSRCVPLAHPPTWRGQRNGTGHGPYKGLPVRIWKKDGRIKEGILICACHTLGDKYSVWCFWSVRIF